MCLTVLESFSLLIGWNIQISILNFTSIFQKNLKDLQMPVFYSVEVIFYFSIVLARADTFGESLVILAFAGKYPVCPYISLFVDSCFSFLHYLTLSFIRNHFIKTSTRIWKCRLYILSKKVLRKFRATLLVTIKIHLVMKISICCENVNLLWKFQSPVRISRCRENLNLLWYNQSICHETMNMSWNNHSPWKNQSIIIVAAVDLVRFSLYLVYRWHLCICERRFQVTLCIMCR